MKDEIITLRVDDLRAVFERVTGTPAAWTYFYTAVHDKALVTADDGHPNPDKPFNPAFPRLTH